MWVRVFCSECALLMQVFEVLGTLATSTHETSRETAIEILGGLCEDDRINAALMASGAAFGPLQAMMCSASVEAQMAGTHFLATLCERGV